MQYWEYLSQEVYAIFFLESQILRKIKQNRVDPRHPFRNAFWQCQQVSTLNALQL